MGFEKPTVRVHSSGCLATTNVGAGETSAREDFLFSGESIFDRKSRFAYVLNRSAVSVFEAVALGSSNKGSDSAWQARFSLLKEPHK